MQKIVIFVVTLLLASTVQAKPTILEPNVVLVKS